MAKSIKEQLRDLEEDSSSENVTKVLTRSGYRLAKRAAQIARELGDEGLLPVLEIAFRRFCEKGEKTDPGCEAKIAIMEGLRSMRWDEEDFFVDACRYRQFEPVWGGSVDTAAEVRVLAAFALAEMNSRSAMSELIDLLVDPEPGCRAGAIRALAASQQDAAKYLLRLKAHHGDTDPQVLGECLTGLLSIAYDEGHPIALKYLASESLDARLEAAVALGTARKPNALEPLQRQYRIAEEREEKRMMLMAIALLQYDEAVDFVLEQTKSSEVQIVCAAIHALSHVRDRNRIKQRLEPLLKKEGVHPDIVKSFQDGFTT